MKKLLVLVGIAAASVVWLAPNASACDVGSFYDVDHQICQGTPPAAPGYEQPPSNHPYPRHYYPGYGGGQ